MPNPNERCRNCRFLIDTYANRKARYHRYPPQAKRETEFHAPLCRDRLSSIFGDFLK